MGLSACRIPQYRARNINVELPPSPSLSLFFYSPFPLPLSSLSAFTSFVPPRRNETLAEIETRHSKKIFHALTRASELRTVSC